MRSRLRTGLLLMLVTSFACGDKQDSAASAQATASAARSAEPKPTTSSAASASSSSAAHSPAPPGDKQSQSHAGFLNVKKMRDGGWFSEITAGGGAELQKPLDEFKAKCGTDPFGLVDEVVWAGEKSEWVAVAQSKASVDAISKCLKDAGGAKDKTVAGKPGLEISGTVIVVAEGSVTFGSEAMVAAVLEGKRPKPAGPPADGVAVGEHDIVRLFMAPEKPVRELSLLLKSTDKVFDLQATLLATSAQGAKDLQKMLEGGQGSLLDGLEKEAHIKVAPPKIEVQGDKVLISAAFQGSVKEQAVLVGALGVVGVFGVRRYLQNSKLAEAKNTVVAISRGLSSAAAGDAKHVFPRSEAPVPKAVPAGKKVQTAAKDWEGAGWKAAKFQISEPQYYSYSWVTSADGKKCTVTAQGDLDGDGVLSKISQELTIDAAGTVEIGKQLKLENEFE